MFFDLHMWKVLKKVVSVFLLPTFLVTNIAFAQDIKTSSSTLAPQSRIQLLGEHLMIMNRLNAWATTADGKLYPSGVQRLREEYAAEHSKDVDLAQKLAEFDKCCELYDAFTKKQAELFAKKIIANVRLLEGKVSMCIGSDPFGHFGVI